MSLKDLYKSNKREGYIIPALDAFLVSRVDRDQDRAFNVNAPSSAGRWLRRRYYSRVGTEHDNFGSPDSIARGQRIFDNGSGFHERIQNYLKEQGMLLMDEIPILIPDYNVQGHTDGIVEIDFGECAMLELKSINDNGFSKLKEAKPEHVLQGLTYLFGAETRRLYIHDTYKTLDEYIDSEYERRDYFSSFYQHLKGGRKFTREEKIAYQVQLHIDMDDILFGLEKPITKAIFLYENKNDQSLKEFTVERNSLTEPLLQEELDKCLYLNEAVKNRKVPNREYTKSSFQCKWCSFNSTCYPV